MASCVRSVDTAMSADPDEGRQAPDGVRAVVRAMDILSAFARADHGLTVNDLMAQVDLSRTTLYRLLYTLQECGYVVGEGDPQRFHLGPAVGQLSWAWTQQLDIARMARPALQTLAAHTRETVALFTPGAGTRTCAAEIPSMQPLSFKRGVGYTEHIARGATGRALLAWMDLDADVLRQYCRETGNEPARLREELERVRRRGYATSRDELIQGAVAVASPFFDGSGRVAGSIGVFGPSVRLPQERIQGFTPQVMAAAQEVSRALGAPKAAGARGKGAGH